MIAVQKHRKSTHLFIPSSFCFYNFVKKSIPWVILALVLLMAVFGAGIELNPDGPGPGGAETA